LLDAGAIGTLTSVEIFWRMSTFRSDRRGDALAWMESLPGGPFLEVLPHLVYLLQAVAGDLVLESILTGGRLPTGGPAELRALFRSARGPVSLGVSLAAEPVQKVLIVRGTRMTAQVDLATNLLVRQPAHSDSSVARSVAAASAAWQIGSGLAGNALRQAMGRLPRGHDGLLRAFYRALDAAEPFPVGGESGLATMVVLDAITSRLATHVERSA
jgi:predicted dehydrogenase